MMKLVSMTRVDKIECHKKNFGQKLINGDSSSSQSYQEEYRIDIMMNRYASSATLL